MILENQINLIMPKPVSKSKNPKTQKQKTAMCGGVGSKKSNQSSPQHLHQHSPPKSTHCALCHKSLSLMVSQSDSEDDIAEIGFKCGHKFHYRCLKPYIISMKGKCPACKENI